MTKNVLTFWTQFREGLYRLGSELSVNAMPLLPSFSHFCSTFTLRKLIFCDTLSWLYFAMGLLISICRMSIFFGQFSDALP